MFDKKNIKQFFSYFCVGGVSALVEWTLFFLIEYFWNLQYLLAVFISFIFSTTVNYFLGRTFTFKSSSYEKKKVKEFLFVFGVSALGLLFNFILMYIFVDIVGMNTNLLKTVAKICSTGIVFLWNFLSRKFLIYKESN